MLTIDALHADIEVVIVLGALLVGNIWDVTARLRSMQARFYSGPLWAYRSIGIFGVVAGIVVVARVVG